MSKTAKWVITLLLALVILVVINKVSNKTEADESVPASATEATTINDDPEKDETLNNNEQVSAETKSNTVEFLSPEQVKIINSCLSGLDYRETQSLNSLTGALEDKHKVKRENFAENDVYELKLTNGEIRRLRLYSDNGQKKLGFYSIDEDGDPMAIPLPVDHEFLPSKNIINEYLSKGTIQSRETEYIIPIGAGSIFNVFEKDGQIVELNYTHNNANLFCDESTCSCK